MDPLLSLQRWLLIQPLSLGFVEGTNHSAFSPASTDLLRDGFPLPGPGTETGAPRLLLPCPHVGLREGLRGDPRSTSVRVWGILGGPGRGQS